MNYGSFGTNVDQIKCGFTMFLKELDLSKCGVQGNQWRNNVSTYCMY
jgi:hypothetical protein